MAAGAGEQHIATAAADNVMAWLLGDAALKGRRASKGQPPSMAQPEGGTGREPGGVEERADAAAGQSGCRDAAHRQECQPDASSLPGQARPDAAPATGADADAVGGTAASTRRWDRLRGRVSSSRIATVAALARGKHDAPAGRAACPPDQAASATATRSGLTPTFAGGRHAAASRQADVPGAKPALAGMRGRVNRRTNAELLAETLGRHAAGREGSRGALAMADRRATFPKFTEQGERFGGADSGAGPDTLLTPSEKRRAAAVVRIWQRAARSGGAAGGAAATGGGTSAANDRSMTAHAINGSDGRGRAADTAPVGEVELPEARAALVQGQVVDFSAEGTSTSGGVTGAGAARDEDDTPPPTDEILSWAPHRTPWMEALYIRLCRAIARGEDYKAVIVLPVHPDGPLRASRAIQVRGRARSLLS